MFNSARAKLISYFFFFLIVIGGLLFLLLDRLVLAEFEQIERNEARIAITRAMSAIRGDGQSLRAWARDIGPWDDTYSFVESGDLDYVNDNFDPEALENLELDLLAFVDNADTVVWSHLSSEQSIDSFHYEELPGLNDRDSEWASSTGVVGLHRMDADSVYWVAVHPIVKSNYSGPSRGAIILGRRLDEKRFEELIQSSIADFELQPLPLGRSNGIAPDEDKFDEGIVEVIREDGETSAYTVLYDFNDEAVLTLKVRAHRVATTNGAKAIHTVMVVFAVLAFLGLLLFQLLLVRLKRSNGLI